MAGSRPWPVTRREYQALFAPCIRLLWDCEFIWCRRQISWQWQVQCRRQLFFKSPCPRHQRPSLILDRYYVLAKRHRYFKYISTCMVNCQNCQVLFIRSHLRSHCSCTEAIHTYICILKCTKKAHRAENQLADARSRRVTTEHRKT